MELENLNLVELNAQEVKEVDGGQWPSIGWWMDVGFSYGSGSRHFWENPYAGQVV